MSYGTALCEAAYVILVAHLAILAGAQRYGALTTYSQRTDLSYGTYVYGWPVQQTLVQLIPGMAVTTLLTLSLAIVPIFAIGSWTFVEKPALRWKRIDPRAVLFRLPT